MERREIFDRISIFESLGDDERDLLFDVTTTKRLAARDFLCRKGDEGNQLYAVMSGRLKVVAAGGDGKEFVFNVMGPGDVIGEIALMDGDRRSATVVALEPCELLTLHRRDLWPFFERHPKVAVHVASVLAGRVRRLSERAEDVSFLPLPSRMAKTLVALAASYGGEDGTAADIRLPQQDLADMLGATRESINKWLRVWEEDGVVELRRARIIVRDLDALDDIAAYSGL